MEDQLVALLASTQSNADGPRQQAEKDLKAAQSNPAFPISLVNVAAHASVSTEIRQSALTVLRNFIQKNWSEDDEDDDGGMPRVIIPDTTKDQLRPKLLDIAIKEEADRKLRTSASYTVGKIAIHDFPEQWPTLLPTLLEVIPKASDTQLHGALKVLSDLVEESISDEQFFSMAKSIIDVVYQVATDENRKLFRRALAVSVFRGCFDLMDMVKDDHPKEVKAFAEAAIQGWLPFSQHIMALQLPADRTQPEAVDGLIALKLQIFKTLIKIKMVFPQLLLPQATALFSSTWEDLSRLRGIYEYQYINNDIQARLEDNDGMAYTLDFLVLEELDFLNQCLRAAPVQKELEAQFNGRPAHEAPWVLELMQIMVAYSRITREQADLWEIDTSLYISEETSVSANYESRTASGDLLVKLGEWLNQRALEGLFAYTKTLFTENDTTAWRAQEAALYLFTQLASDFEDRGQVMQPEICHAYLEIITYTLTHAQPLLQARGYLAAGTLSQTYDPAQSLLDKTIQSISHNDSEIVQMACIRAIEGFVRSESAPRDRQVPILNAINSFLDGKNMEDLEDADDLILTLVESLRAVISLNGRVVVDPAVKSVDTLFMLGKHGASNFMVTIIVTEAFEEIVQDMADPAAYAALCDRVLPTLAGAFSVADMTNDNPLVVLAADLLVRLVKYGPEPLPPGFIANSLPKLKRCLMESTEGEVLRPGAEALKYMLAHDHGQVFAWHDEHNQSGLEVCLVVIDRLLSTSLEDNSASEVGGLAAELVEKAGQERLGPYLLKLLQAVAVRLESAQAAAFIQSLILVFARLSLAGAQDVVHFLSTTDINGQTGLQVVMSKWLENSINFAGYDEIRQNVIALSKLYSLNDTRLTSTMVKGDLIVPTSDRIMTRSRAKQNPDQFTIIPAPLKILKVLIEELLSASGVLGASNAAAAAAAAMFADDGDDDDGDEGWEDDPDTIDLSLPQTKAGLMSLAGEGGINSRQRDDETQGYLSEFFVRAARENVADFGHWYGLLSEDERGKLNELAAAQ